jgi:hypothetical protein
MSAKTRTLVDRFVDFVATQRFEDAYRLLNPGGRFILIGQTPASGVYIGIDDIFARLAPALSGFTERPKIEFSDIVIDGNTAFLRAVGKGAGTYGVYEQPYYGYFLRVEGDGLSEIVEYLDTVQLEVALYGKRFVIA